MDPSIRLATIDDAEQIAAIYAPVVRETAISFELEPPTAGEMQHAFRRHANSYRGWYASKPVSSSAMSMPFPTRRGPPISGP